jgi:hypothetical protein
MRLECIAALTHKPTIMIYEYQNRHLGSLERKLQLIADGQELELTPEEALIYGVDHTDEFPDDWDERKEDDNGR